MLTYGYPPARVLELDGCEWTELDLDGIGAPVSSFDHSAFVFCTLKWLDQTPGQKAVLKNKSILLKAT